MFGALIFEFAWIFPIFMIGVATCIATIIVLPIVVIHLLISHERSPD